MTEPCCANCRWLAHGVIAVMAHLRPIMRDTSLQHSANDTLICDHWERRE